MRKSGKPIVSQRELQQLWAAFARLPRTIQLGLFVLVLIGVGLYAAGGLRPGGPPGPALTTDGVGSFTFCVWNVENLFDDSDDRRRQVDEQYDNAFARNPALRKLKYDRIASALMRMNGGRGPDVIACVEVESVRAAELLRDELNSRAGDPARRYESLAMKNLDGGRHIAPCVISRVPLSQASTRLHGRQLRVLETRATVNGHDLTILAAHWTSKLKQRDGGDGESGRENYARTLRGVYEDVVRKDPAADVLVCGDFNATPDEEEVRTDLGAVGDPTQVKASAGTGHPLLLNLMADKPGDRFGTLWYGGKSLVYDHVCVSPGMLDAAGWACDPESVQTFTEGLYRATGNPRRPWRFGDPDHAMKDADRGFADHFPVLVRLTVQPPAGRTPD